MLGNNDKQTWKKKLMNQLMTMDGAQVVGIARLLGVELVHYEEDKPVLHDGEQILLDIFTKTEALNREQRRQLMKLTHKAAKEKGSVNYGTDTENK